MSIKRSYTVNIENLSNQSSQNVFAKVQTFQESIENVVLESLSGASSSTTGSLNSFIRLVSFQDSKGKIVRTEFPLDKYYMIRGEKNVFPFLQLFTIPKDYGQNPQ